MSAEQTQKIQEKAHELDFVACEFTPLHSFENEKKNFLKWLQNGYHGEMAFLERNVEKRFKPKLLQNKFKSAIVVLTNYFPEKQPPEYQIPKVSKYAMGKDYHTEVKNRLCKLREYINNEIVPITSRCFVDSAPIYEKKMAIDAGLGWEGKNTLLINRYYGSFVFVSELLTDIELSGKTQVETNHCGTCSRCVDDCPTGALQPYLLDATKCISYLTIEKKSFDKSENLKTSPWIYGCDICQDVCPWNKNLKPTSIKEFSTKPFLLSAGIPEWEKLNATEFENIFSSSPLFRTGFEQIKRNINWIKNERGVKRPPLSQGKN